MKSRLRVYFDNAASCRPDPKILGHYYAYASRFYANQEAAHQLACSLREKIDLAAMELSQKLCGEKTKVCWGDSGSGLFRLLGAFEGFRGGNIVTTAMEHPALVAALEGTQAEIRIAKTNKGLVDLKHLAEQLDKKTALVSIHHIQGETGIIQNLAAIGEVISLHAPKSVFMADTIQSAGKIAIPWKEAGLDLVPISGHKFGAPSGAALLLNDKKPQLSKLAKHLERCRKEYYTASRPEPAKLLALSMGLCKKQDEQAKDLKKVTEINTFLRQELTKLKLFNDKKIILTVAPKLASPYILHFIVPGYQSGVLVRMLSEEGVYFSAGSACLSETKEPSVALGAMGFSREGAYAGIRLSFCPQNTPRHADIFLEKFQKALLDY